MSKILLPAWKQLSSALNTMNSLQRALPYLDSQPSRLASKKAGGTVRNKIGRTIRKHRGIKAHDGTFVHQDQVLATQYGIRFYPGENVWMEGNWTLKAAYDGIVVISTESLNPYPDSPLYLPVQKGAIIQKKFFNIIPTPLHGKFKLISET
ncbi:unnamed protein product [Lymnaea stagnalis]|uniref:39S ribosomal protein L27, mitochondrial n=1 Tax=Lymnaea stagnalis TaxID=6523 RepID=A0AAV2H120_LYMST